MAEGTRMRTLEESLRKAELQSQQVQQLAMKTQDVVSDSIDRMLQEMKALAEQMKVELQKRREREVEDRTLLIKIHQEKFVISWEELEQIFSRCGIIEYIEVLCPGDEFHSKVRFQNKDSAIRAFDSLNGRNVYDDCCILELFMGFPISDRQSKIETAPIEDASQEMESTPQIVEYSGEQELLCYSAKSYPLNLGEKHNSSPSMIDDPSQEEIEAASKGIDATPQLGSSEAFAKDHRQESFLSGSNLIQEDSGKIEAQVDSEHVAASFGEIGNGIPSFQEEIEAQDRAINKNLKQPQFESSKVISCLSGVVVVEVSSKELMGCSIEVSSKPIETRRTESGMNSVRFLESSNALKVFVEMPRRGVEWLIAIVDESAEVEGSVETAMVEFWNAYNLFDEMPKKGISVIGYGSWNFDPGGVHRHDCMCWDIVVDRALMRENASSSSCVATSADRGLAVNLVFDPGGKHVEEPCYYLRSPVQGLISLPFDGYSFRMESTRQSLISLPYDREKMQYFLALERFSIDSYVEVLTFLILICDTGGLESYQVSGGFRNVSAEICVAEGMGSYRVFGGIVIPDPGGGSASTGVCIRVVKDLIIVFDPGGWRLSSSIVSSGYRVSCSRMIFDPGILGSITTCYCVEEVGVLTLYTSPVFIIAFGSNGKVATIMGDCDGFVIFPHNLEGSLESSASVDHFR